MPKLNNRLEIETIAQKELIEYNFYKKINETLENGNTTQIMQIISAYDIYRDADLRYYRNLKGIK
jgi:hypothetical protein